MWYKNICTKTEPKTDILKILRQIREQMSVEIKDMSCEQEIAYINKLLTEKRVKY